MFYKMINNNNNYSDGNYCSQSSTTGMTLKRNNNPELFEKKLKENLSCLDRSQSNAVYSDSSNILIKAPAGSGKTACAISAIASYRYENLIDRVCAITFTRAARAEMEQRLNDMGIFDIEVTTIHVWSRNLLDELSKKYHFKLNILQENQIKAILQMLIEDYLKTSRLRSINLDILYTYVVGSKKMDITDAFRRTLNALDNRYTHYKRTNGLYDFTDYPLYLYNILTAYNEEITGIDALFVDEFQDVDGIQLQVFDKVMAKKKFFIGDSWQCIYAFRGCDPEAFNKLNDGFDVFNLEYNYRSYQEIINYATTVYEGLKDNLWGDCYISQYDWCNPSFITCYRGQGGRVIVLNPYGEAIEVINGNQVKQLRQPIQSIYDFLKQKSPIILCRTNKQVKAIQELGWSNATTVHQSKGLEYDNVVVVDTQIKELEDLNIAYVAMTRARDGLLILPWTSLEDILRKYKLNPFGI